MRKLIAMGFLIFVFLGCAKICKFGTTGDSSGINCFALLAQAKVGMSQKEVVETIGTPQNKRIDIPYRGKTYDEAWIYNTDPATVLYFKNGVLEHKDYQQ